MYVDLQNLWHNREDQGFSIIIQSAVRVAILPQADASLPGLILELKPGLDLLGHV